MSWDSVPWFVGGGAQHSPEVARLLAYAATSGAEGLVSPGDLKVGALTVPGGSVTVAPGAALIRNRAAGGEDQTYVARNPVEDKVSIAATGANFRSDLIVAQIEDPFMPGEPWQDPEDPTVGPYVFTRVIPNVPRGTTSLQDIPAYAGRSAVVLARVDIPANTGAITKAMITDLRKLALPRRDSAVAVGIPSGGTLNSTTEILWPSLSPTFEIPEWATHVDIIATVSGLNQQGGVAYSSHRLRLGTASPVYSAATQIDNDAPGNGAQENVSVTLVLSDTIPAAMRGTRQPIALLSKRLNDDAGRLTPRGGTQMLFDVRFSEKVV